MHAWLRIPSVIRAPCSEGCCYLFPSMKLLLFCYAMLTVKAMLFYVLRRNFDEHFFSFSYLSTSEKKNCHCFLETSLTLWWAKETKTSCFMFGPAALRWFHLLTNEIKRWNILSLHITEPTPGPLSKLTQSHDSNSLPVVHSDRISCKLRSRSGQQYVVPTYRPSN